MANQDVLALTGTQKFQVQMINLVEKGIMESGAKFTEYGKMCVINAMAACITFCKTNGYDLQKVDQTSLKIALQNVGFTELNFAATPVEAYFDPSKNADGTVMLAIKPQGAGNEKLTRRFGVNVKELKSAILIREGDEYTLPGFDGEKSTPFKWQPKSFDGKIMMIVYPLLKTDGSYEYLIATREGIKPNIIAQIRKSNMHTFKKKNDKGLWVDDVVARDKFYEEINTEFEKLTVDEILADPKWRKELNPTYTSGGSVESMVIRKMKNNALKNYPREFSNQFIADAVNSMWEDKDDSLFEKKEKVIDVDAVKKVESEINEEPKSENAIKDFDVDEDGVAEKKETPIKGTPIEETPIKESKEESEEKVDEYSDLM